MICKIRTLILLMVLLAGSSNLVFGQDHGKISGIVTDAETNEPLPNANITIEGISLGAASNINGEYYIINLEPKIYTLVGSYIGYNKIRVENVQVHSGLTTIINIKLSSKTISSQEVIIVAKRPTIQKDVSTSLNMAYGKDIEVMPSVVDVSGYIGQQAGVQGLTVRGGSIDQTAIMIDGMVAVDPTTNQPYTSLPLSAIQEVSLIKGGFNAEYGDIRSGLVNITTKDGDKSQYHVSFDFRQSPAHQKHFGPSMFSPENYYLGPYFDPQVAFTGTQNWPKYKQQQYATSFQGWNAWVQQNPQWGLTPKQAQEVFEWTHTVDADPAWGIAGSEALGQKGRTEGTEPDWNAEGSFSGPVPFVSKYLGDLTFFGSYKGNQTYYAVPYTRTNNLQQDAQLKLVSHITDGMKFSLEGIYSDRKGVNYYLGNGDDGSFMGIDNSIFQANAENSYYYWQSSFSPLDLYSRMLIANFEDVISPSTFFTITASLNSNQYKSDGYLDLRDTSTLIRLGNLSLNGVPWGWTSDPFQQSVDQPDRRTFGGDNGGMLYDNSHSSSVNLKGDLYSQVNPNNGVKAGFNFTFTNMYVNREKYKDRSQEEVITLPPPADWYSEQFNAFPVMGAIYLQDKIELEGMVANIGIRSDYFNTNTISYLVDPFSQYYSAQYATVFTDSVPQQSVKGKLKISPRIGVAFPISEIAKFFFNYGHFYSYPQSSQLYGTIRGQSQAITQVGNPNALLPETVAYELGVELNISDTYLLQITGYYKDITDQLTTVEYISTNGVSYHSVQNQNTADIRGLEFQLTKRIGDWFKGWLNFTYMSTNSADLGRGVYYQENQLNVQQGYIDYDASLQNPVPQPFARASVEFFTSPDLGIFLGDWHLVIQPSWSSGSYFSYSPTGLPEPYFTNNIHWPDYWNVDLRITKYFSFKGYDLSIYLDATNVFNFKNFAPGVDEGFSDSQDESAYLASLHLPIYSGAVYQAAGLTAGNDKIGDLRSASKPYINDPNLTSSLWGTTRQIFFGMNLNF